MSSRPHTTEEPAPWGSAALALSGAAAAAGLAWCLDLFLLRTPVLTSLGSQRPLTPLYAFWRPRADFQGLLLFGLAAFLVVYLLPRLLDRRQVSERGFVLVLALASLLLPLLLLTVREPLANLGRNLLYYPGEEVYFDALRVSGLRDFYGRYVELIPRLSLHGQHFPPGHATWIALVFRAAGASPFWIGCAVLAAFSAGVCAAYGLFRSRLGEGAARPAALLLLAVPSLLDFACTSMDAVFFAAATAALWIALPAFERGFGPRSLLAGLALLGCTLLSYSALPLGLFVLLWGGFGMLFARRRREPRAAALGLGALAGMGLGFVAGALALRSVLGFDLLKAFVTARQEGVELMTGVTGRDLRDLYFQITYGNLAALLIGSGVALGALLWLRRRQGGPLDPAAALSVGLAIAILAGAGIHQMETERIWLYVVPWLVLLAFRRGPGAVPVGEEGEGEGTAGFLSPGALRLLLAAGFLQAAAMEATLFTLW